MNDPSEASADHAGVVVPPPLIYVAFFLVGLGVQRYAPAPSLPVAMGRVVGGGLVLLSLLLATWSFRRFWASGTSIVPVRPTTALSGRPAANDFAATSRSGTTSKFSIANILPVRPMPA